MVSLKNRCLIYAVEWLLNFLQNPTNSSSLYMAAARPVETR